MKQRVTIIYTEVLYDNATDRKGVNVNSIKNPDHAILPAGINQVPTNFTLFEFQKRFTDEGWNQVDSGQDGIIIFEHDA